MSFELRRKMQKELDDLKLKISELENTLRPMEHKNSMEYQKLLKELERSYKRKGELIAVLKTIRQFER